MLKITPFYQSHINAGAKMTDFGGWDMPLHYGSQIAEHEVVRTAAGVFDVSHMRPADISGVDATKALLKLLANDVRKLQPFQALYTAMLDENGGIIDDLIVYRLFTDGQTPRYRIVHNAGRADDDINWIKTQIKINGWQVEYTPRFDLGMLAIQGPQARALAIKVSFVKSIASELSGLKNFYAYEDKTLNSVFARTGYTGEDGFEWMFPIEHAEKLWQELLTLGVKPCGLGARDTLRLEAGMALYGQDLDLQHNPLECGIAWTVALKDEREFIGKNKLTNTRCQTLGLILSGGGVLRPHQKLRTSEGLEGEVTSGTFSPTMKKSIALARLPLSVKINDEVSVNIRDKWLSAKVVKPPFVRNGAIQV